MRWRYRVAAIVSVALLWVLANLPASLLKHAVDQSQIALVAPQGTVWRGSAQFVSELGLTGQLRWQTVLWRPGAEVFLQDKNSNVAARIDFGFNQHQITVRGDLDAQTLAPLLNRYDLFIPGTFNLSTTSLAWADNRLALLQPSELRWSGGQTQYILANRRYGAWMPSLLASISSRTDGTLQADITDPTTNVSGVNPAALLVLRLKPNGNVYFGVSRGMLRLANYPWSGVEDDSELVFEVERRLTGNLP